MRILVGHTNQMPELNQFRALPGRETKFDDILAFGNGYAQLEYCEGMSWSELLAQCPAGWVPDVYIHWSPEYNVTPPGLEEAECLTVGVMGDWILGGVALRSIGGAYDLLVADEAGCDALERAGFPNLVSGLLWGYDPQLHRRASAETEKDIDLLMIGSFNHAVQQERSRWLARVARLSSKYRVVLTSGVTGDAYSELMNRAKLVFNRSISNGINMRVYEAMACGSVQLYERENTEIGQYFQDGEHLLLYGEDDFEAVVDRWLAPEKSNDLKQIADKAFEAVQPHSYAQHFSNFLTEIEPLVREKKRGRLGPRSFASDPKAKIKALQLRTHLSNGMTFSGLENAFSELLRSASPDELNDLRSSLSLVLCRHAWELDGANRATLFEQAVELCEAMIADGPNWITPKFNLGTILLQTGQAEAGEVIYRECLELLEGADLQASQLRGLIFTGGFGVFEVDRERLWLEYDPTSEDWAKRTAIALRHRLLVGLGELSFLRSEFDEASRHLVKALELHPCDGATSFAAATALRKSGDGIGALPLFKRAMERTPFLFEAWQECISLLVEREDFNEAKAVGDDVLAILDACPNYHETYSAFRALRSNLDELELNALTTEGNTHA